MHSARPRAVIGWRSIHWIKIIRKCTEAGRRDGMRRNTFDELTELEKEWIENINAALRKLPNYGGDLNHSLTFISKEDAEKFYDSFNIGDKYIPNQYLSTTKSGVYNDDGQVQIYIQNARKGKDLGELGIEDEILYPIGSKFEILNSIQRDGKFYILLREV